MMSIEATKPEVRHHRTLMLLSPEEQYVGYAVRRQSRCRPRYDHGARLPEPSRPPIRSRPSLPFGSVRVGSHRGSGFLPPVEALGRPRDRAGRIDPARGSVAASGDRERQACGGRATGGVVGGHRTLDPVPAQLARNREAGLPARNARFLDHHPPVLIRGRGSPTNGRASSAAAGLSASRGVASRRRASASRLASPTRP